jgi:hypothetical protein
MLINIIDVGAPNTHAAKNGRSYQSLEVTYKDEQAQTKTKKLMSFSNPSVFNHIKDLTKGEVVNVTTVKNVKGYWDWTGIGNEGDAPAATQSKPATAQAGGRVTGSNYETKEERAARQILIVRQSSLSSAVELVAATSTEPSTVENVIAIAKQFESYVFSKSTGIDAINELEDDIPL